MRELKIETIIYMEMKEGETEQEAKMRFWDEFSTENISTETSLGNCYYEVIEY